MLPEELYPRVGLEAMRCRHLGFGADYFEVVIVPRTTAWMILMFVLDSNLNSFKMVVIISPYESGHICDCSVKSRKAS